MKSFVIAIAAMLVAGTASASVPLFAAKRPTGITADSNTKGRSYVNGKVAKLIKRPDGQVTVQSAGIYVDITPRGNPPPLVTYTGRDKSTGVCEVVSFQAPAGHAAATSGGQRASASGRAGQGRFDGRVHRWMRSRSEAIIEATQDVRGLCIAALSADPVRGSTDPSHNPLADNPAGHPSKGRREIIRAG